MPTSDPNDRALRGEISGAVRAGNPELAAELRHELGLRNIERAVAKYLGERRLTVIEVRRLRRVLEEHGPERQPVDSVAV